MQLSAGAGQRGEQPAMRSRGRPIVERPANAVILRRTALLIFSFLEIRQHVRVAPAIVA